jgi:hypothetical protein
LGGFVLILIAAWLSGLTTEICKETNTGQEHCTPYNLAPFILIQIREGLHSVEGIITALATIAIAWFTWTLWKSNKAAGEIAEKQSTILSQQTDIQRKQYRAAHRPHLLIRGMSLTDLTMNVGMKLAAQVPVVNIGNTPATVVELAARMFIVSDIKGINLGGEFHKMDVTGFSPIERGTYLKFGVRMDDAVSQAELYGINQKTRFLICAGYEQYKDEDGGLRSTGWARYLKPEINRFVPIDDPEYEFAY